MSLSKQYKITNKLKTIKDSKLYSQLAEIAKLSEDIYLVNMWSYPYTKKITLVVNNLELAFKLNIYDNINVIVSTQKNIGNILKKEWVREYFVSQMPEFMVCDIITLIEGGETPESAWDILVTMWLPTNKTAQQILEYQHE